MFKSRVISLFVLSVSIMLCQCKVEAYHYDYKKPTKRFKLSNKVDEISGLTALNDSTVICVDDEQGKIFFIDLEEGDIQSQMKFGKKADYEGVEVVDSSVYILKSNGQVQRKFINVEQSDTAVTYELDLDKFDTEGLGFTENGNLIIACKGRKKSAEERQIFVYDLHKDKLTLLTRITYRKVKRYVKRNNLDEKLKHLLIDKEEKIRFSPSGIARHPLTGNLYALSATDQYLIVLSPNGRILSIEELNKKKFKQPEGICFTTDGLLVISNEARNGKATLLLFQPIVE